MEISLEEACTDADVIEVTADGVERTVTSPGTSGDATPDATLTLPDAADDEEVDAIVAAVSAYLQSRDTPGAADPAGVTRGELSEGQWVVSGRMRQIGINRGRMPTDAPSDPWAAAGRAVR